MSNLGRSVDEIVGLLEREGDEGAVSACEAIEAWAKDRRTADLAELARSLEARCDGAASKDHFETAVDHIEDQLSLIPEDAAVDALLSLALTRRERSVTVARSRATRIRAFASRLGYGQTPAVFLEHLSRRADSSDHREILACWMHEVVLRGHSLAADERAAGFQKTLLSASHPLARLPLALLPAEREVPSYMPLYGDQGIGRAIETLASGTMSARTIPPPADGAAVRATKVEDPPTVSRLLTAAGPWSEGKRSKTEAKVFALDPAVDASSLGSWLLRALPLDATTATARLDCARTGVDAVFGSLFAAAANGGAYSAGLGGAYGRLAAWASLSALVGAEASADAATIESIARECAFLTFRAPGPWFHDVAWDLGALTLRRDGKTVAVLAATDTE